ncbi:MAG: peptidoglycan DD-metalloendopeptidase family protein [Pseudomonadota bacterium]
MRFLPALVLLLASLSLSAALPDHNPTPGGVAVVPIGPATGEQPPKARYYGKRVTVVKDDGQWVALVGIPLNGKAGPDKLKVGKRKVPFEVKHRDYPEQWLTIENKRKVNPNPEDLKRIRKEVAPQRAAKRHFDENTWPDLVMHKPVEGPYSSHFGLKRFFNEQPRNPHGGLDIAADTGTPIEAPAPGLVVEAGDFFFNGNSVFIDHGQGVISFYCHMNSIEVEPGQRVERGQTIGTVGATGRVTGPHLHWSVGLNGTWVDPSLFMPKDQRPEAWSASENTN